MKILLVISNLEYGGAQRQLIQLANGLFRVGHQVQVCVLSKYIPLAAELEIPDEDFLIIEKKAKFDITVAYRLARVIRIVGFDIVHGYLFDAEIASRLATAWAGRAVMIGSERNSNYKMKKIHLLVYGVTRKLQAHCIANSYSGARFNAKALGYNSNHYDVVWNCVDTNRFLDHDESDLRSSLGIDPECFVIGMFASFKPQKNHSMILRALRELTECLPSVKLLMIGDQLHGGAQATSEYRQSVLGQIDRYNLTNSCIVLGNVIDVERYYRVCDITVLPSYFEGLPNVLLESLASGVPAVVTDIADNSRIIEHGKSGYVVAVDDVTAMAGYILSMAKNPRDRDEFAKAARMRAIQKFSVESMLMRTVQVYDKVSREKHNRSAVFN